MNKQRTTTAGEPRPALTPRQRANLELLLLEIEIKMAREKRDCDMEAEDKRVLCLV